MNYNKKNEHRGKVLFRALLALLFWLPIPLASNRPWAWGLMQIASYLLFLATLYTFAGSLTDQLKKYKVPLLVFGCFVALCLIQLTPLPLHVLSTISPNAAVLYASTDQAVGTVSVDPAQSVISLYKTLSYVCLFICTLLLCSTTKRLQTLLLAAVVIGVFQAMYGALEVLLGLNYSLVFNLPVKEIATGTFVYKNHYANYLMLCLSMGIGLLVGNLLKNDGNASSKHRIRSLLETFLNGKALIRIALAIMVIALVMSRSRMGNTAFFAAMTIVGLLGLVLIKKRTKGLTVLIISMFIIDMFILSAWFGLDKVKSRLEQTSFAQETRDEVLRDSLPLLQDFALTGSGMGSFYGIFPKYQSDAVTMFYDHAHNDYLQFAIEGGLLSTIILFLLPLLAATQCISALKNRNNTVMQGTAFGCLMAVIGMALHMSVDFPLQAPSNAALFIVILALAFKTNDRQIKT